MKFPQVNMFRQVQPIVNKNANRYISKTNN